MVSSSVGEAVGSLGVGAVVGGVVGGVVGDRVSADGFQLARQVEYDVVVTRHGGREDERTVCLGSRSRHFGAGLVLKTEGSAFGRRIS